MITEARQRVEEANALWDQANATCRRVIEAMALLDIEHPLYSEMLDELGAAEASRREAGTRSEMAMADWFAERLAGMNEINNMKAKVAQ